MKRYLLFWGDVYYPSGGWEDFVNSYDTIEEAKTEGEKGNVNGSVWWHIVDIETSSIVFKDGRDDF